MKNDFIAASFRGRKRGYVYFVECLPLQAVKIGFTASQPAKRVRALQCGSVAPLRLNCYFPGTMQDEAALHEAFSFLHIHGEWFRSSGKLHDMLLCLNLHGVGGRELSFETFARAVWVVLYEGRPDEPQEARDIYDQTGDWRPFRHLIEIDQ